MRPLRILVVSPTFAPAVNGLANVALKYCQGLRDYGHKVEVITSGIASYTHDGIDVKTFNIRGNFSLKNPLQGEISKYIRYIQSETHDLIICHALQTGIVDLTFLFAKTPILYFSHGVSWKSPIMPGLPYRIARIINYLPYRVLGPMIIKRAKYAIFLGNDTVNDRTFDSRYFHQNNKKTISNASDFPTNHPKEYVNKNRLKLLIVGACSPEKGFDRLLNLIGKLNTQSVESVTICTFESGCYFTKFKRAIKATNTLINIEFVLNKSGDQLLPYYLNADALLNLSHSECYPLVVADAENCRLPTICYDTGYQREIPGAYIAKSTDDVAALINSFPNNREVFRKLSKSTKPRHWPDACRELNAYIDEKILPALKIHHKRFSA